MARKIDTPIQNRKNSVAIEHALASFRAIVKLNDDVAQAFASRATVRKLKKKEFMLREGEICDRVSFIHKGYVRLFYNVDGAENTIQFFFEDSWYTDFDSFLTGNKTLENVQALAPLEVLELKKTDVYELYDAFPVFERIGRMMAENAFLSVSRLNKMRANQKPEERYLTLLKQRPEVVEKIPQKYVASYLGVKPESLSRIRKRISDR